MKKIIKNLTITTFILVGFFLFNSRAEAVCVNVRNGTNTSCAGQHPNYCGPSTMSNGDLAVLCCENAQDNPQCPGYTNPEEGGTGRGEGGTDREEGGTGRGEGGTSDPNDPFGTVDNPFSAGPLSLTEGKGLIALLSTLIRLIFIIAGIYAFIRILLGGLKFIHSGGDPKEIESAWQNIWQSVVGLVVIISSFAIAALIGQIIYGNPSAILNPTLVTP